MKRAAGVLVFGLAMLVLGATVGAFRLAAMHGVLATRVLEPLYSHHGELMIFGFLAPVIAAERYVGSLQTIRVPSVMSLMPWMMTVGFLLRAVYWLAGGAVVGFFGAALFLAAVALFAWLLLILVQFTGYGTPFRIMFVGVMALGVSFMLTLWRTPVLNLPLVLQLLTFPILTIVGERIELTRIVNPRLASRGRWVLALAWASLVLLVVQVVATLNVTNIPLVLVGGALLILPVMLGWGERRIMRFGENGLRAYISWHLAFAYAWFALGGLLTVIFAFWRAHGIYDAASHALAIGFVLTMILAHAPVIIPALTGITVDYQHLSVVPLLVLTVGTVMRVGGYLLSELGLYWAPIIGYSGFVMLTGVMLVFAMMARAANVLTTS